MSFQLPSPTCRELTIRDVDDEELGFTREYIPACYHSSSFTSFPLAMERPPSLGSILTDTSLPDSLFSELSDAPEAKVYITKPPRTRPDALPDISFSPALDHTRESKRPLTLLLHPGDASA